MEISFKGKEARITGLAAFDPVHIFENGQAFRFTDVGDGVYEGVAFGHFLRVQKKEDTVCLFPVTEEEFAEIWRGYFDLDRDYAGLFVDCADEALKRGCEYAPGLRVLRQEPFETLISFIISTNNNVKRIRGIIKKICEACGTAFACEGGEYHAFPTPAQLAGMSEVQLKECGCGYRAPYILGTACAVLAGFNLDQLYDMPYESAKMELEQLPGVGPKVADCVLLFAYGKTQAFPADVWVRRVMKELYGVEDIKKIQSYAVERFGAQAGIAQQYLFYYARENGL
ncbi:8-oxoguanine DNA glycosylase [Christensenellaceae bacterium OttesenSCG-928-K19]|nr:8-oxoguanine DNA glycosylase [Christensenellaceae bacterium OttesenSCG-928-K19]